MKTINKILLTFVLPLFLACGCAAPQKSLHGGKTAALHKTYAKDGRPAEYTIKDKDIAALRKQGFYPYLELAPQDALELAPVVPQNAPLIGVLLNRGNGNEYMIPADYVYAALKAGARVRLISFDDIPPQLEGLDGIILTGGSFASPPQWYMTYGKEKFPPVKKRYRAYELIINSAAKSGMPLFGICAGMQMMGALLSDREIKIYSDLSAITPLKHRVPAKEGLYAHTIDITPGSKLHAATGAKNLRVNSRHSQALAPYTLQGLASVKATAFAPDGVIEALDFPLHPNFTAVQFHPETMAYNGDENAQKIFDAFIKECAAYKEKTK